MNRPFERIPRWLRLTPGQWAVVIGAAVFAALVGFVVQSQKEDSYAATARVLFRTAELDRAIFGSPVLSGSGEAERDAATNTKLVVSNEVAERVARVAGLPANQAEELRSTAAPFITARARRRWTGVASASSVAVRRTWGSAWMPA